MPLLAWGTALMDRLSRDGAATEQYPALVLSTYPSRHVGIHYSKERWSMQKSPNVVVVGGGIAGVTAALNLAQRGLHVLLVEREPALGGNAGTVCCKAIAGKCQLCGGCLLPDRFAAAREQDNIEILTQTTVTQCKRVNGGFDFELSPALGPSTPLHSAAVVLATGFDHVDAHTKGPYLYGILPAVTTGEEMEKRLKEQGRAAYDALKLA